MPALAGTIRYCFWTNWLRLSARGESRPKRRTEKSFSLTPGTPVKWGPEEGQSPAKHDHADPAGERHPTDNPGRPWSVFPRAQRLDLCEHRRVEKQDVQAGDCHRK